MNPGKLNQRIQIYKYTEGFDDFGAPIKEEQVIHECWASVRNKSGKEQFKSVEPFTKVITSFLIRYHEGIDETMKIKFNGESYNIIYVDNYNFENKWLEITAEKVV